MEWTKTKQIRDEDLFVGKRMWMFNLNLTPRYTKRRDFSCPSVVYITRLGYTISLKSPHTNIIRGYDWLNLSKWQVGQTAGFFETEEDAVSCWNEAIDSCITKVEEDTRNLKDDYFIGDEYYKLTKDRNPEMTSWTTTSEEDIFKEGVSKYMVNFTSPFYYQVGLDVPFTIRHSSRSLGGGTYPLYLGKNQYVSKNSPKNLWTLLFPSKSDIALYYSYIGRYDVCNKIDKWAETTIETLKNYKV